MGHEVAGWRTTTMRLGRGVVMPTGSQPVPMTLGANHAGAIAAVGMDGDHFAVDIKPGATKEDASYATGIAPSKLGCQPGRYRISKADAESALQHIAVTGFEERLSADPMRVWTRMRGKAGKIYHVDAQNRGFIVVKVDIKLSGSAQDIAEVRRMEQDIENVLRKDGFVVDVHFRDSPNANDVNLHRGWSTLWSWSVFAGARSYAHEIGHQLGLNDNYDLREHCSNLDLGKLHRSLTCFTGYFQAVAGYRPGEPTLMGGGGDKLSGAEVLTISGR